MELEIVLFDGRREADRVLVEGSDRELLFARVRGVVKEQEAAGYGTRVLVRDGPELKRRRAYLVESVFDEGLPLEEAQKGRLKQAFLSLPRHRYLPWQLLDLAYFDEPVEIGFGQTISQPSTVTLMTAWLDPRPEDRVLEVGTGSGYQAAILARLCREVYSLERIPALHEEAARLFLIEGLDAIHLRLGDGSKGWPEAAPFDKIIQTAASEAIPEALAAQLRPGGRMVLPLGRRDLPGFPHALTVVDKGPDGRLRMQKVSDSRFVPLIQDRPAA